MEVGNTGKRPPTLEKVLADAVANIDKPHHNVERVVILRGAPHEYAYQVFRRGQKEHERGVLTY